MRPGIRSLAIATCTTAVVAAAVLGTTTVRGASAAGASGEFAAADEPGGSSQRARSSRPDTSPELDRSPEPSSEPDRSPDDGPDGLATSSDVGFVTPVEGGGRELEVTDDESLVAALDTAEAGDTIRLAAGTYSPVVISGNGTADAPITLTGPPEAVFTGDTTGYTVHVEGASHWQLLGFTVTGGGKGIVVDDGQSLLLDSLTVGETGEEAVHFRSASSDNVIQRSTIHDTGLRKPRFGEGVYVGSAKSNWKRYGADGGPDLSMDNRVLGNTFERITAENVDIKEETAGTVVAGNRFDGSAISGENHADSVVDIKGYDARVVDNVTTGNSPELGNIIETHVITEPETSGCGNTIEGNTVEGFEPSGELVAVDEKCE